MSYPHLFLGRVTSVRIRRREITVGGQRREFVFLTITGRRDIDQWTVTLDPGPGDRIQFIEEEE